MQPLLRLSLKRGMWVGGLVLAVGVAALATRRTTPGRYRLELNAPRDPMCYYGSAWNDGDPLLMHDASDGETIVMTREFAWEDGCIWRATETLRPVSAAEYVYEYEEHPIYCGCDMRPAPACPTVGTVKVVRVD